VATPFLCLPETLLDGNFSSMRILVTLVADEDELRSWFW
jgi:hypothetical protein